MQIVEICENRSFVPILTVTCSLFLMHALHIHHALSCKSAVLLFYAQ